MTVVMECNTIFPGRTKDFFRKSDAMRAYFQRVMIAEKRVFGHYPKVTPDDTDIIPLRMGDLTQIPLSILAPILRGSDHFVVFGSSYIRGPLFNFLPDRTINIHMGISPYYRGSSCNFWAMYDKNPQFVGATIHYLSEKLDGGNILLHAIPLAQPVDPFTYGMLSVRAAIEGLVTEVIAPGIRLDEGVPQDSLPDTIRYSVNKDFTDAVADEYLERAVSQEEMFEAVCHLPDRFADVPPYVATEWEEGKD